MTAVEVIRPASSVAELVAVGGVWLVVVEVTDLDGDLVDAAVSIVVTDPAAVDTPAVVERVDVGCYRATFRPVLPGRHVATASTSTSSALFVAYAAGRTTAAGMPTADDAAVYLGGAASSWSPDDLTDALAVESSAQRDVCRVPAAYPDSLRGALLRRVARNLAMRRLPLAISGGDVDTGPTVLPGNDPEVRRLEKPHRRMFVA